METLYSRQKISGSVEARFIVVCRNTESRCRRGTRVGVSAYDAAVRVAGRDALPRDPALHVWKLPFADYAAGALCPTFSLFAFSRSMNVQRRSRGSATLPRHACKYADTLIRRHADTRPPKALVGRGLLCFGDCLLAFNRWLLRRSV